MLYSATNIKMQLEIKIKSKIKKKNQIKFIQQKYNEILALSLIEGVGERPQDILCEINSSRVAWGLLHTQRRSVFSRNSYMSVASPKRS